MRQQPELSQFRILEILQLHYCLDIVALTFLELGNDAATFVYRAENKNGENYFLKLRSAAQFHAASLLVPHHLQAHNIANILALTPTQKNELWVYEKDFVITLYPFLEAQDASSTGLTNYQWFELGKTLRQIHDHSLPPELQAQAPQEKFVPTRKDTLARILFALEQQNFTDPVQQELKMFYQKQQNKILNILEKTRTLASQLYKTVLPRVLCHADFHTWNVLQDNKQQLWIVDWDEVMFAPKERDLMFVIGGIAKNLVNSQQTKSFLEGYGDAVIHQPALSYYRYAWAAQDMGAYAEQVFTPSLSIEKRRTDLQGFKNLFAPGNIVEIAEGLE